MENLTAASYRDEATARKVIESLRWPDGPVCSHCGVIGHAYAVTGRAGLYRCAEPKCRKDFTCTTGTVMERSHVPLHKWLEAFAILCESKKGVSSHQLHRHLKISYKAAWFLGHRIREAMRDGGLVAALGGKGKIVEADETYYGSVDKPNRRHRTTSGKPFKKGGRRGPSNKRPIVALVERGGNVRTFHVASADKWTVSDIVTTNVARESRLHTDESRLYGDMGAFFAAHETVKHSDDEYVRDDVHTNSAEGYFSIFKRGMRGVYQHCKEKHLHRYLAEYDFRYNHRIRLGYNDGDRAALAIKGIEGKRLTYRQPH